MKTTEILLERTKQIWDNYNEHPFVKGIEDGSLDKEKFKFYIVQDYLYLEEFAKAFALGVVKTKSLKTANLFAKYIPVMNGELDVHDGFLKDFGVTEEEIKNTKRSLLNLSYTSYMLRVSYEGGEGEILAAILSCAYSYEVIAKKMIERSPECVNHPFYGHWIKGYASEEYGRDNVVLLETLDEMTKDYTEEEIEHLVDIFEACSRYEMEFWEMSWNMSL